MRFWFFRSTEVSLQDHISRDLAPGDRLPSSREMARRFKLHPNTVNLAYRRLERERWVEIRQGSGVYVRDRSSAQPAPASAPSEYLTHLIRETVRCARMLKLDQEQLRQNLDRAWHAPLTRRFLLIEPDPALSGIVAAELAAVSSEPILTSPFPLSEDHLQRIAEDPALQCLVLPSKAERVRASLPATASLTVLKVRSVTGSLLPFMPLPSHALVAVVSGWQPFLDLARTMLVAAGLPADALVLILRDGSAFKLSETLAPADAVICDSLSATLLPPHPRMLPFRLLADDTQV
jgi:GntR family transcriptional regulator